MAQQGYSLLRIIIIDSFWKGQVNELDLSGHTQLEGTNGAGKTSLMRLLPLFYGMRPSDIVSKVDQARNFVDYYLPRASSMLIYEYQRPHGQTCMVLVCSDGRGAQYKFIDAAYNSEHFIGDNHQRRSMKEIEGFYRQIGCDSTSYLAVEKYRQVIQNLRSGRKLKDVRQLQNRYSFCEQSSPHIDKVINGTIEKNLDFEAVKRMLVAIASDYLARGTGEEKEQISLNKEDISSWLADIQASRAVQKVADKIGLWQGEFNSLDSLLNKLQHLHFEILAHQVSLNEQQETSAEKKRQAQQQLSTLVHELETTKQALSKQVSNLKADIEGDQSRIDLLDTDKMKYDDDDAANYQLQADRAPHIQDQLNEINAIINAFEGNINKLQQKFADLIQTLKFQHLQDQTNNQTKVTSIREVATQKLTKIIDVDRLQNRELEQQLNGRNIALQLKKQQLESDLKLEQQKLSQVQLNQVQLAPELQQDIEQNTQALSDAKDKQNSLYKAHSQALQQYNGLIKRRDNQLEKYAQEKRQLEGLSTEYEQVRAQLIPADGSLQYFLDNEAQAENWKDNIGRLLTSEQLTRCDLAPTWVGGDSFYGLSLDLAPLQSNDSLFLDEIQLREKCEALGDKITEQAARIEQLDEHIGLLTKEISVAEADCATATQDLTKNELNLQQLNVQKENFEVKKAVAIKAYTDAVNQQLKTLESEQKRLVKQQQQYTDDAEEQRHELHNQLLEKRMVVEGDRDSQLALLVEESTESDANYKQRLKDLKKQQNTDLAKLDPDGEVDKRTTERKAIEQALKQCAVFEQKAHHYQHFMSDRYCHRDGLVEQNQNRLVQQRSIETQLEDANVRLNSDITALRSDIKKLNDKKTYAEELLNQLADSQRHCEKQGIEALESAGQPHNQADLSVSFCADWLNQFKVIEKRLGEQLNKFNDGFKKKHASSDLYDNWQKLVAEHDNFSAAKSLFKYREPIVELLSSAQQKQKNTYQLVSVNATMINEFYQHVENFARQIKTIGKQLSTKVTGLAHFDALAEISVTTVMKQEELEYWGSLKEFSKAYDLCRDQLSDGVGEIPDDLVYAMQKLATYLPSEGFVLNHCNLFDIEFTITEKGQVKHARNARQLKKVSSTGLSYLAMLSLFAGLLGMLRGESQFGSQIILPVDELGELAAENIDLLLKMFSDNDIHILSASPSTDRHILSLYDRHYKLKDNKIYHAEIPQSRLDELLANRASQQQTATAKQEL
ncbi:ATP-binding protein [Shewanella sp. GutCb]|uniref:ATP-binding protein n=1 Tax=Shewanella sp. GutCb TaxID=2058315 RepID=UPI000C7AEA8F|nr:ATP-binding protein [Shewanella sp. GutCb]PKG74097.1 ATP-binding protein [Shewanella sp. GutCb]